MLASTQGTWRRSLTTFLLTAVLASPAWATDGRTAVGLCIDSTANGDRCGWAVNDKGEIDICNKSGCVTCPSATAQCTVASRTRPRPTGTLPSGAEVTTAVGVFKVDPKPFRGAIPKILTAKPSRG